nr:MAG: replication associated protein [Arizlama virus]
MEEVVEDSTKSRNWIATMHYGRNESYTLEELEAGLERLKAKTTYGIVGREVCPNTKRLHLQCFFQFKELQRYSTLRRALLVWWKPMAKHATPEDNFTYCSKGGNFVQWGAMVGTQENKTAGRAAGGQRTQDKWKHCLECIKLNKYDDIDPQIFICYYNAIMNIAKRYIELPPCLTWSTTPNIWLYGVAGCGKSKRAWDTYPNAYRKPCNKWWDGFDPRIHKVVIIDDFDEQHKVLCHHLKIWADRYPFILEVKGGAIGARPDIVVVTSNWAPSEIWSNPNDLEPIMRRFKVINMSPLVPRNSKAQLVLPETPPGTATGAFASETQASTVLKVDRTLDFDTQDEEEEM